LPTGIGPTQTAAKIGMPLPIPAIQSENNPAPPDSLYSIVTVDGSGRVADISVMTALSWTLGAPLDFTITNESIVVRPSPSGLYNRTSPSCLTIPARIRRRCRISAGDRVVLTADPRRNLLIVTSVRVLHEALSGYHNTVLGTGGDDID
jgi:hypothetical protein